MEIALVNTEQFCVFRMPVASAFYSPDPPINARYPTSCFPCFSVSCTSDMAQKTAVKTIGKTGEKLKEPEEYRVILLNDHYTTMDFVVEVLVMIFHKSIDDANRIMLDVHRKGKGVVGIYSWDIAATKADQVHAAAKEHEFPLRCMVEPA
jgi:ATP-dependent Clp protease adaptor protein ClpS